MKDLLVMECYMPWLYQCPYLGYDAVSWFSPIVGKIGRRCVG